MVTFRILLLAVAAIIPASATAAIETADGKPDSSSSPDFGLSSLLRSVVSFFKPSSLPQRTRREQTSREISSLSPIFELDLNRPTEFNLDLLDEEDAVLLQLQGSEKIPGFSLDQTTKSVKYTPPIDRSFLYDTTAKVDQFIDDLSKVAVVADFGVNGGG